MESKSVGRSATDARLFSGGSSYHDVVAVGAVAAPKPTIVKPKATTANPFASETGGNAAVKDGSDTVTNEPLTSIAKPPVRISFGTAVAAAKPAHVSPPKVQVVEQEIPDRYIVRHPFEPDHPKQLRLVLEDILTVQQRLDSGWWSVTNQNDEVSNDTYQQCGQCCFVNLFFFPAVFLLSSLIYLSLLMICLLWYRSLVGVLRGTCGH